MWQRFGGAVRVGKGRHRVVARVIADVGSIRLLNLDGTAAKIETDDDARKPYGLARPTLLANPNPIDELITAIADEKDPGTTPLVTVLGAHAAHIDGLNDVATVMMQPLVDAEGRRAGRAAHGRAVRARRRRVPRADAPHEREGALHARRPPAIRGSGTRAHGSSSTTPSSAASSRPSSRSRRSPPTCPASPRSPSSSLACTASSAGAPSACAPSRISPSASPTIARPSALYVASLEEDGSLAEADAVATRLKKLDADSEVDLDRAIARRDWKAAIAELRRLEKRRPDRKEIAARIANVLARSGDPSAAAEQLAKALAKNPADAGTRLRIADHAYAKGDTMALRRALAEALQAGSKGLEIREAVELIEGASLLEPYRTDGRKVIKEFEAWEKTRQARWTAPPRASSTTRRRGCTPTARARCSSTRSSACSRRRRSSKEAEQQPPGRPRAEPPRHQAGRLDPRARDASPASRRSRCRTSRSAITSRSSTSPRTPSEGGKGKRYRGPHWFFREADKGYWRSEFVVLTPKDRDVDIEIVGNVPKPKMAEKGTFIERRWRVDESPARRRGARQPEPARVPPERARRLGHQPRRTRSSATSTPRVEETPLDPRLRKVARDIVGKIPPAKRDERARALYRWVGEGLQESNETDGRRAITGRAGSRQAAFMYLVRLLGIPTELALVKSRIAMPPVGKMSEVETYDNVVARLDTDVGPRWMVVRDKFAPFGYVPAELRGQPAIRLVPGTPRDTTPSLGAADGVLLEGKATLKEDGSATVEIAQSYVGRMGIGLRAVFDRVPEAKRNEFVETRLLAREPPRRAASRSQDREHRGPRGAARPPHARGGPADRASRRRASWC